MDGVNVRPGHLLPERRDTVEDSRPALHESLGLDLKYHGFAVEASTFEGWKTLAFLKRRLYFRSHQMTICFLICLGDWYVEFR